MGAVVVITGASSGIGWELARRFAVEKWEVIATTRRTEMEIDFDLWPQDSARIEVMPLDLIDDRSIERLAERLSSREHGVDVLVNNAGICLLGALEAVAESNLRVSFETNVFGPLALTRLLLPGMRSRGTGRVIFLGAIGGLLNTPYLGAYCAAKHALDCLSATLDLELQPFGIRVVTIHPGATATGIGEKLLGDEGRGTVYQGPAGRYANGLQERIANSPDTAEGLAAEIYRICQLSAPQQRYVVSSSTGPLLAALVEELERLHARERVSARQLQEGSYGPTDKTLLDGPRDRDSA